MLAFFLACTLLSPEDQAARWDLDDDGLARPADCDDADPDVQRRSWYLDGDGDGYGAGSAVDSCSSPGDEYVENADDCDDDRGDAFPGAVEICNQADDDCDDVIDNDPEPVPWYQDDDRDGYGRDDAVVMSCPEVEGHTRFDGDCDDTDDAVNPDAIEVCNTIDDDCDELIDDEDDSVDGQSAWYVDGDADGWGDDTDTVVQCFKPDGYSGAAGDCDDADDAYNPGAAEDDCTDPNDYNCDGSTGYEDGDEDGYPACEDCDDAVPSVNEPSDWYADSDSDGYGDPDDTLVECTVPSGYVADDQDCDDTDADRNPTTVWYADSDGDGYGDPDATLSQCEQPSSYVADDQDCDDTKSSKNPDTNWYADSDGDGYGDPGAKLTQCEEPSGYERDNDDCDDTDADINPDADEVCLDGVDNDCDSTVDSCDAIPATDADVELLPDSTDAGFAKLAGIARAGDIDGDGQTDILLGDVKYGEDSLSNSGGVWIFYGPVSSQDTSTADVQIVGDARNQSCGRFFAVLDDWGSDGVDDLALGCYQDALATSQGGAVYVWTSTPTSGDINDAGMAFVGHDGASNGSWAGHYLDAGGDIDGDGTGDLLIGARYGGESSGEGRAYVVYGPKTNDVWLLEDQADGVLEGEASSDQFGISVRGGGDIDGDGFDDVLVGASGNDDTDTSAGAAYLYLGPVTGSPAADVEVDGVLSGDNLGILVGPAGDLDSDGYDDSYACAPDEDTNGSRAGVCYVFGGAASPTWSTPTASIHGDDANDRVGNLRTVTGFDVDVDGNSDLWIGSTAHSDGASSNGAAWLFLGPVTGTMDADDGDLKLVGEGDDALFGGSIESAGDQDGDGLPDILVGSEGAEGSEGTDAGAAYIFYTGAWL